MNITSAKYLQDVETEENSVVEVTVGGNKMFVPMDTNNSDYAEILKQVADGDLTIADAD